MVCPKCGNEIQSDEKFCGKCGAKIVNNKTKKIILLIVVSVIITVIILSIIIFNNKFKSSNKNVNNIKSEEINKYETKNINNLNELITIGKQVGKDDIIENIASEALLESCSLDKRYIIENATIDTQSYTINDKLIGCYIFYIEPQYVNQGYEAYGIKPIFTGYTIKALEGVIKINDFNIWLKENRKSMQEIIDEGIVEVSKGIKSDCGFITEGLDKSGTDLAKQTTVNDVGTISSIKGDINKYALDKQWISKETYENMENERKTNEEEIRTQNKKDNAKILINMIVKNCTITDVDLNGNLYNRMMCDSLQKQLEDLEGISGLPEEITEDSFPLTITYQGQTFEITKNGEVIKK